MIVDRIGGRRTAIISDALSLATVLVLSVALFLDTVPLWLIIVTQTLGVLFDGSGAIARDTLIPTVAKQDDVPLIRASSVQETSENTAMFSGPLAAGVLIATSGESVTLLGPLTFLLIAWVAVFGPLSVLVFPAWFALAERSAGALGVLLGARALGGILGGFAFAAIGPEGSQLLVVHPDQCPVHDRAGRAAAPRAGFDQRGRAVVHGRARLRRIAAHHQHRLLLAHTRAAPGPSERCVVRDGAGRPALLRLCCSAGSSPRRQRRPASPSSWPATP